MKKGAMGIAVGIGIGVVVAVIALIYMVVSAFQDKAYERLSISENGVEIKVIEVLGMHSKRPEIHVKDLKSGDQFVYYWSFGPAPYPVDLQAIGHFWVGDQSLSEQRRKISAEEITQDLANQEPFVVSQLTREQRNGKNKSDMPQETWENFRKVLNTHFSEIQKSVQSLASAAVHPSGYQSQYLLVFQNDLQDQTQKFRAFNGRNFNIENGYSIQMVDGQVTSFLGQMVPSSQGIVILETSISHDRDGLKLFLDSQDSQGKKPTDYYPVVKSVPYQ